jgi:hypothetical protein
MNGLFSEAELRSACQVLFGNNIDPPIEFFAYLQPDGVKAAFRKRARETHPDTNAENLVNPASRTCEAFHQVNDAYKLLFSFVNQNNPVKQDRSKCNVHFSNNGHPSGHFYFNGPLPHRRLEIGRYLYYRGLIPYHSLISAITWQRKQRPPLGRIARNLGLLSDDAVQMVLRSRKCKGHFGDKAIHHGLLTKPQVSLLLSHQRSRQQKLGKYFIESGYFSENEMEMAVLEMRRHNAKIPLQP